MRRTVGAVSIGVGATVAAAIFGAIVLVVGYARKLVTPPQRREEDIRVLAVDLPHGTIVLAATPEARMRGRYEFWFDRDSGHARLGDVLSSDGERVRRSIETVDFGRLDRAIRGHLSGSLHLGPWEVGVPYQRVVVLTELGEAPAWWFPAATESDAWVIHVHGRGARRQEPLRGVPAVHAAGWHSLVVSYRNDGEAPASVDARYGLGHTEWPDIAAAMQFAVDSGARRVVLCGWSMGASIALQAVLRSPEVAQATVGIILESAAIDWVDILRFHSALLRLPRRMGNTVGQLLASRMAPWLTGVAKPIDFDALDVVARSAALRTPILALHSRDDEFVPITGVRRLAELRPDLVELVEFSEARHAKLWNHDAAQWDETVTRWLRAR